MDDNVAVDIQRGLRGHDGRAASGPARQQRTGTGVWTRKARWAIARSPRRASRGQGKTLRPKRLRCAGSGLRGSDLEALRRVRRAKRATDRSWRIRLAEGSRKGGVRMGKASSEWRAKSRSAAPSQKCVRSPRGQAEVEAGWGLKMRERGAKEETASWRIAWKFGGPWRRFHQAQPNGPSRHPCRQLLGLVSVIRSSHLRGPRPCLPPPSIGATYTGT